jgi:hypothetical protein
MSSPVNHNVSARTNSSAPTCSLSIDSFKKIEIGSISGNYLTNIARNSALNPFVFMPILAVLIPTQRKVKVYPSFQNCH